MLLNVGSYLQLNHNNNLAVKMLPEVTVICNNACIDIIIDNGNIFLISFTLND